MRNLYNIQMWSRTDVLMFYLRFLTIDSICNTCLYRKWTT